MVTVEIITSALNEEDSLDELFRRLYLVFKSENNYTFKITIFDNGSIDDTWKIIKSRTSHTLRGFRMSRTFPLDAAFTAGLDICTSDVAIIMTSDLQDPPEVIPLLLREYEKGFDQVFVKVLNRKSVPLIRRLLTKLFYYLINKFTNGLVPINVSDFRLMSRRTYLALNQLRERHRFMRGISAWVGFKSTEIEIDRPDRFAGESSWLKISIFSVIGNSLKNIFAFSSAPLVWVSGFGLVMSILSFLTLLLISVIWMLGSVPFAGFGTIVAIISLGFSLTIFSLGIIAQYLGLIYDETKQRPLYLIQEST